MHGRGAPQCLRQLDCLHRLQPGPSDRDADLAVRSFRYRIALRVRPRRIAGREPAVSAWCAVPACAGDTEKGAVDPLDVGRIFATAGDDERLRTQAS